MDKINGFLQNAAILRFYNRSKTRQMWLIYIFVLPIKLALRILMISRTSN